MKMIVGAKKLNAFLNDGLQQREFDVITAVDIEFSFDLINNILYYSVLPSYIDSYFKSLCEEILPGYDNIFVLSFFHELGHYMTQDRFSEEDGDVYDELCEKIQSKKFSKEEYETYTHSPVEIAATTGGCFYIKEHKEEVKQFGKDFNQLLIVFYNDNELERYLE